MKIIFVLALLGLGASQDTEVNAPDELAQNDRNINQQQSNKGGDYLVSDEEYAALKGVAPPSVGGYGSVQSYGIAQVNSASYGIPVPVPQAPAPAYGPTVPPVPNSRPAPVSAGYASAAIASQAANVAPMMPMPYAFQYAVKDDSVDLNFGHSVSSDGNVVTGSYYVLLPDGRLQTVNYQADDNGYVAQVTYDDDDDDDDKDSTPKPQTNSQQKATGNQQSQQLQSGGYGVPVPVPTAAPRPIANAPPAQAYPVPTSTASTGPAVPARTPTSPAASPATTTTPKPAPQPQPQAQPPQTQQGAVLTVKTPSLPPAQVSSPVAVQNSNQASTGQQGAALTVQLSSPAPPNVQQQPAQQTPATPTTTKPLAIASSTQAPVASSTTTNRPQQQQQQQQGPLLTVAVAPPPASQTNSQIFVTDQTTAKPQSPPTAAKATPTANPGQPGVAVVVSGQQTPSAPVQPAGQVVTSAPRPSAAVNATITVQGSPTGSPQPAATTARPATTAAQQQSTVRPTAAPTQTASQAPSASLGLLQLQLCASCPPRFPPEAQAQPAPVNVPVQQTPSIAPAPTTGVQQPAQASVPAGAYNLADDQSAYWAAY